MGQKIVYSKEDFTFRLETGNTHYKSLAIMIGPWLRIETSPSFPSRMREDRDPQEVSSLKGKEHVTPTNNVQSTITLT